MSSFEAYEAALVQRRDELREGDRAYDLHCAAILETTVYSHADAQPTDRQRILDVGCGLGFLAAKFARHDSDVVGIDPSELAITLAREEHIHDGAPENLRFYASGAEEFPRQMAELGESPFDRAFLNMVLHSVDDVTCDRILRGVHAALRPYGSLALIVPDGDWVVQKLVEQAQAAGMQRTEGLAWIRGQLQQDKIDLRASIRGGDPYPEPITVYPRELKDYGRLLMNAGFKVIVKSHPVARPEEVVEHVLPYWEWSDHLAGFDLSARLRHILITAAYPA